MGSPQMGAPNAGGVGKFFSTCREVSDADALLPKICVHRLR